MAAISKKEVSRIGPVHNFVDNFEPVINERLLEWDKKLRPHIIIDDSDISLSPTNPHYDKIVREIRLRYSHRSKGWKVTHSILASHNNHGWFDFS